jgi:hypothetical protein
MDSETLVEQQLDDGQLILEKAARHGFDVAAAFWLKAASDGRWRFYLVAPAVESDGLASAYRQLHPVVYAAPQPVSINPLGIRLIGPSHPIAKDVLAIQDRFPPSDPARPPIRYDGNYLGDTSVDDAYVYPVCAVAP